MKGRCVVSKNLLIVEGDSDKLFVERLKTIVEANAEVSSICRIDECLSLGGLNNLRYKLEEKINNGDKKKSNEQTFEDVYKKIGVILDADEVGILKRVNDINNAVKFITDDVEIASPDTWYRSEKLDVDISCHILNVNGYGELETLLRAIKSQDSPFADCLEAWRACLKNQKKEVNQKVFDKFWIEIYGRYDCCPEKSGDKCTSKLTLQKDYVWNFSHSALTGLRNYLAMFN